MHALVVGSTGLVGSELVKLLENDSAFSKITALVRKKTNHQYSKVEEVVVNFENLPQESFENKDVVFCCLGTTIKTAGSKEAFRMVDYEYPFLTAKIAKQKEIKKFAIVTAMGASAKSSIFYNQVKGEIEEALENLGFESLGIFRPSMLLGNRSEVRMGETIGKYVMNLFGWAIPKNYKAIEAKSVAKAMLEFAKEGSTKGNRIVLSGEML
jgi:uncharacterized protein YbjT (DUF2867 family)